VDPYDGAMEHRDPGGSRPVLVAVSGRDIVRVTLEHRGRQYIGESRVTEERGRLAASAAATLQALEALTPRGVDFRLDWCGVVDPGGGVAAAVVVFATVTVAGVPMPQTGAAVIHQDVQVAAVRAALDAMNRRLDIMRA
jgi:hypothetical protein